MNCLYLCGPITDEPYTREWREEVKKQLVSTNITCLDPLRGKAKVKGLGLRSNVPGHLFVARDWMDVRHSQLVLANLLFIPERQSIGTFMELGAARAWDVPFLVIAEHEHIVKHPFITSTALEVVPTLQKGIQAVRFYFKEEFLHLEKRVIPV